MWSTTGTRTCSTTQSDRVCSFWDTSYSLSKPFSNKCKTQNGLFGIISSKLGLLFPGILWNWIQTGICFGDPSWDLRQWREEGAVAEVEGYFNSIYTYCIYYCVNCYCKKWKAAKSLLSTSLCIKWLHKDFQNIKSYKCSFNVGEKNNGNSETAGEKSSHWQILRIVCDLDACVALDPTGNWSAPPSHQKRFKLSLGLTGLQ